MTQNYRRGSLVVGQYALVQGSILGGQPAANSGVNVNPNNPITPPGRYVSIMPLAGAAAYPIQLKMDDGSTRTVFDSRPFDSGSAQRPSGQLFQVQPQTFAQAFGAPGANSAAFGLDDSKVTNALFPKPQNGRSFVAGSIPNSAGYVSGLYGIEASDDPAFFASGPGLVSPFTYCAIYGYVLTNQAPSNISVPIPLPDYLNNGFLATGAGGIGAVKCAFLGAGQGVLRHVFSLTNYTSPHVIYKWFLDPLSTKWVPGGTLNISPNTAGANVAMIEETINLALPTWLYLQLDANDPTNNPTWIATISRGGQ